MAYDFTGIKAITIPEGNVKKITDSTGKVLWQALIVIANVPSQKGTLTYNGSEQSPSWNNFDSNQLSIGGNKRTNAGSYYAVFTPKDGYCWSDGSTTAKTVLWKIGKAAGSMSISPTSITLNWSNTSKTITVTRAGDGAISAVSSDTSVATVSVSGNIVTVTGIEKTGTATITISVAAGTNHTASTSKTCAVTANFEYEVGYYEQRTITIMPSNSFTASMGILADKNGLSLSGEPVEFTASSYYSAYQMLGYSIYFYISFAENNVQKYFQIMDIDSYDANLGMTLRVREAYAYKS